MKSEGGTGYLRSGKFRQEIKKLNTHTKKEREENFNTTIFFKLLSVYI